LFAAVAASTAFGAATAHHRASTTTHHASTTRHRASAANGHASASSSHGKRHARKGSPKAARPRGQQAIEPGRVTEIQQALIREHYLTGEANGQWDAATKAAMEKYQADQGWQTKLTPDSRALKKLGLGPDYSNAINAKKANFTEPPPASTIPPVVTAGFAAAAGVNP
jgi:peptidoglycan hydrolase-like protein with peptidoglycan-binding domain